MHRRQCIAPIRLCCNEAHYQIGDAALEEKDYEKAADHFATCMNYSDARDKYKESYYQLAEKEFSKKNY